MRDVMQPELQEELLKQWAAQVKRSPVPVSLSMALVAFMASQYVSAWYWGTWIALVVATQGMRWHVFRRLPDRQHIPVEQRVDLALPQRQVHALERVHTREALPDALHLEEDLPRAGDGGGGGARLGGGHRDLAGYLPRWDR